MLLPVSFAEILKIETSDRNLSKEFGGKDRQSLGFTGFPIFQRDAYDAMPYRTPLGSS